MAVLNRKVLRDLRDGAGVLTTVVAIIAVGIGSFIGLRAAQRILENSQSDYYNRYRFADFWVDLKKAPLTAVPRVAELPGVAAVEARVVFDVILDLPGVVQPIVGRLISTPADGIDRTINGICLVRGAGFSDDRNEEVIVSEVFAAAHGLRPGDRIGLILNRKRESFVIVGTAISPEYVYMVRGAGDLIPDPEHFGVLYIKEKYARDVLDFKDACNQIVGQMLPGEHDDVEILLDRVDRLLDAYGVLATTPRTRQASNRFLSDEIAGLGRTAWVMPPIFLGVAALVLNIIMSRFAERQRTIIGTLKALGYSRRQVLGHFLAFGVTVGCVGGLAGIGVGVALTHLMIHMYRHFYQFPAFLFSIDPDLLLLSMTLSLAFAVGGTLKGVRAALALQPAEAMRPRPPERGGAVFLERFPRLWRRLGFRTHIALRSIARNPGRSLTGIIASMFATAIVLMSLTMFDSMWFLVQFQFERVLHSDVDIGMRDARSIAALYEGRSLPGVDYAEPMLSLICDFRHGRASRRLAISGLSPVHRLTTPIGSNSRPIEIPLDGLVMSRKLAEILEARVGDHLELTPVRGPRRTVQAPLVSIVDSFLGLECYADIRYLNRTVGEADAVNLLQLSVDPAEINELYRTIKELPDVQGVSVRAQTKANIESTFVKTMSFSFGTLIIFAGVIAFGSVLNASLIEIADRTRDISTFIVLGYRPNQVAGIFFRQNMVISVLGLLLGLPLGCQSVRWIATLYDTELFRMPVVFRPASIVATAAISLAFVLIAQWFVYRQVAKMDWLEGIKVKE
jgi:putative ABC transport system permease protein